MRNVTTVFMARLVAAASIVGACALVAPMPAASPVAAAGPFDTIPGAVEAAAGTHSPQVVAAGNGVFHAVVTQLVGSGNIVAVYRSGDGGRTWQRTASFGHLGAGFPAIAADGDRVAVAYSGYWRDGSNVGRFAPFLVTSVDGGKAWSEPRRLVDEHGGFPAIAVDGDRVWVAWGDSLRGTKDGGATFFATDTQPGRFRPMLAAADGVMVAAFVAYTDGRNHTLATVRQADEPAAEWVAVGEGSGLLAVAAADGRGHVLAREGDRSTVYSAGPGTGFGANVIEERTDAWTSSLAASRGVVAVTVVDRAGTVSVAASSDGGASFAPPLAVAQLPSNPSGYGAVIAAAVPDHSRALPRFEWTAQPRYVDATSDLLPDPVNLLDDAAVRVAAHEQVRVQLDGCASLPAAGREIDEYRWFVDDEQAGSTSGFCEGPEIEVESGDTVEVRLEVVDDTGTRTATSREITPRDLVVVSLGDSVAAGEGSPNQPGAVGIAAGWTDEACHRSAWAGSARAAQLLEEADPHTSVTFIQLACSGAAAVAAQLDQLEQIVGERDVDAVVLSAGAADAGLSEVLSACLLSTNCASGAIASDFAARIAGLPQHYSQIAGRLSGLGVASGDVYVTEYADPTADDFGVANLRCAAQGADRARLAAAGGAAAALAANGGWISDTEALWVRGTVIASLNASVRSAAENHGWNLVGGINEQWTVGHGYCAADPWIVQLGDSAIEQGDLAGAFHPDRAGHEVYARALYSRLAALIAAPWIGTPPDHGEAGGVGALGDLSVLAMSHGVDRQVWSIALTSTGGQPEIGRRRLVDRSLQPATHLVGGGTPALDLGASVAALLHSELIGSRWAPTVVFAQTGVRPNVAVADVRIVQAPNDATRHITGRRTLVEAHLHANVAEATTVTANTTVTARAWDDEHGAHERIVYPPPGGGGRQVTLKPGMNRVLLPVDDTFELAAGEVVTATVTVEDPPGARPDDAVDNEQTTEGGYPLGASDTRPLKVAFAPLDTGGTSVSCEAVAQRADAWVAFARAALPVPDGGVRPSIVCTPFDAVDQSKGGVSKLAARLDAQARLTAYDAVVAVVPDGWLRAASRSSAIGLASGPRAIILEATAPSPALAHELAHALGLDEHTASLVPAAGARVDLRELREGVDWMSAAAQPKHWTGGVTWDRLVALIGDPSSAPEPLVRDGNGLWVVGSMPPPPDEEESDPEPEIGPLLPDDGPADPAPDDSPLVARPLGADGTATGPDVPIALAHVEGWGDGVELGESFAQKIVVPDGTVAVQFLYHDELLEERPLGAAPTVVAGAVEPPDEGDAHPRGTPLTVTWQIDDLDSATFEVSLLASLDGGATWQPLASGFESGPTGSATFPVPRQLTGAVTIRVVAADGSGVDWADTDTFTVAETGGPEDRLVFVSREPLDPATPGGTSTSQIGTMSLDGSDVRMWDLPKVGDIVQAGTGQVLGTYRPEYVPVWAPDSSRVYFVSNLTDHPHTVASGSNACGLGTNKQRVFSTLPDGSDVRVEFDPTTGELCDGVRLGNALTYVSGSTQYALREEAVSDQLWPCLSFSLDGTRMLWGGLLLERIDGEWADPQEVPGLRGVLGWTPERGWPAASDGGTVHLGVAGCPRLSPDGTEVLTKMYPRYLGPTGQHQEGPNRATAQMLVVFDTDSAEPRLLRDREQADAVCSPLRVATAANWTADGRVVVYDPADDGAGCYVWGQFRVSLIDPDTAEWQLAPGGALDLSVDQFGLRLRYPWSLEPFEGPDGVLYLSPRPGLSYSLSQLDALRAIACTWHRHEPGLAEFVPDTYVWDPDGEEIDSSSYYIGGASAYGGLGECYTGFRWGRPPAGGVPPIVADPESAPPDDENAPAEPVDVELPEGIDPVATPEFAPGVAPAVDRTVTIPADRARDLTLLDADGTATRHRLLTDPAGAADGLMRDADDYPVTDDDGVLPLPPLAPGTYQFEVATAGSGVTATLMVEVVAIASAPDAVSVTVGVERTLAPAALLANDVPAVAGNQLVLHAVYGYGAGVADLHPDGSVRVTAGTAGTATFTYLVREVETGGIASATVTVTATSGDTPTTPPTTKPPTPTTTVPLPKPPDAPVVPVGAARFVPLAPARLFDTREGEAAPGPKGRVGPNGSIDVQVAGRLGIPHDAVSVVLNVTVTDTLSPGHVTVYPTGIELPLASSINNVQPGQTRPNLVTVPLGTDGKITLFSLGSVNLLADVAGYYVPGTAAVPDGRFVPLTPQRLFDTRPGEPAPGHKGKLGAGESIDVSVLGVGDIPATGVAAVVVNLTGTEATAPGFLTAYPAGQELPLASNVNLSEAGTTAPNLAIVPLGVGGAITVYSSHGAHVLGDVTGYITDATVTSSVEGLFVPITPERVFDTRTDGGPVAPSTEVDFAIAGVGSIPDDAVGVVLNVAGVEAPSPGFLTVWPFGVDRPLASTLNFAAMPADTRANAAMLPVGAGGRISFYLLNGGHLLADATGYYLGPDGTR